MGSVRKMSCELGLERNEVRLVPYNPEWKHEFERERAKIIPELKLQKEHLQHIGSTSIIHIKSKPVIDMLLGVDDLKSAVSLYEKGLRKHGYYRLRVQREAEIVFAKFKDEDFQIKTHYIHMVEWDGEKWKDLLHFRDYMNQFPESRREYENIKNSYVELNGCQGISEYTEHKEQFVENICKLRESTAKTSDFHRNNV